MKQRALVEYFRLLSAMDSRFTSNELNVQFVWRDAFNRVSKQGETDLKFEAAVTLYNLAAEISTSAVMMNRSDANGLKTACNLYQQAAGVLEQLAAYAKDADWANRTTVDLTPRALQTMTTLMMAQVRAFHSTPSTLLPPSTLWPRLLTRASLGAHDGAGAALLLRARDARRHVPEAARAHRRAARRLLRGSRAGEMSHDLP